MSIEELAMITERIARDADRKMLKALRVARFNRERRGLLNGQGCVAMEHDLTTDSKDNGVIESLYWIICEVAGVDGDA